MNSMSHVYDSCFEYVMFVILYYCSVLINNLGPGGFNYAVKCRMFSTKNHIYD